nr:ORF3 [Torque teno felis virus]
MATRYGVRCRVSSRVRDWFLNRKDLTNRPRDEWQKDRYNMKPKNLLQKSSVGRFLKQISGREISTPMDSS